jgi:hypothetical protein
MSTGWHNFYREGTWPAATAWYASGPTTWVAVVAADEPEDDWFGDLCGDFPSPRALPIDQPPAAGTLVYRRADGSDVEVTTDG